jgi:DNA-binding PadR family transcriptional regulator
MAMTASTDTFLSEPAYFILLSLSPAPKHGYAIMKDVRELSGQRVLLSTGTLYGALKRMLDEGWIIRMAEPDLRGSSRDRKVYQLSDHGRQILREEIARLKNLVVAAERHISEEHP